MIDGVDVSNYQPVIDWRAVAGAGIGFAYVLITDGNRFVNSKSVDQCAGARGVGLDVGGYHFARPNLNDAAQEAQHYRASAPEGLTLPPALDLEAAWLASPAANTDWALRWFDTIDPAVRLIYTNGDGATRHLDSGRLAAAGVQLWYAHPTGAPGDFAGVGAWGTPSIVQWGVAPVAGIAGGVDRDSMTEATLARFTGDDDMNQLEAIAACEQALRVMFGAAPDATPDQFQAHVADLIAARIPAAGAGGAVNVDAIRAVVHDELAKLHLTNT